MQATDLEARQGSARRSAASARRGAHPASLLLPLGLLLGLLLAAVTGCAGPESSPPSESSSASPDSSPRSSPESLPRAEPPPPGTPRLVLFLVVDQMRWDYLDRFADLYEEGLQRLRGESVRFDRTYHRHALTYTAAGHATLVTGLHPARHGIIANSWYTPAGEEVYAADSERHGTGPDLLLASGLGEWIGERYPAAKVFAVGGKDRSSVMLGGRAADGVFWYDDERGGFTSTAAYPQAEAPWLASWNREAGAASFFGRRAWEPFRADAIQRALEEGRIREIDRGRFPRPFPHVPGGAGLAPDEDFFEEVYDTPLLDELTVNVALRLIDDEGLGRDDWPDFLGVALSALDTVGHDWGPDSPEVLDTLLRLDHQLGRLLDHLDREVGLDRVLVVLSADHGVAALPEASGSEASGSEASGSEESARMTGADAFCLQSAEGRMRQALGLPARGRLDGQALPRLLQVGGFWNQEALSALNIAPRRAEEALRTAVESCPGVQRLWTRSELEAGEAPAGVSPERFALYRASYSPERSPDVLIEWQEGFLHLPESTSTTHGTPALHDRHVPWLLRLPSGEGRAVDAEAGTVDIAPTVARLLGVPYPEGLDGRERTDLLP